MNIDVVALLSRCCPVFFRVVGCIGMSQKEWKCEEVDGPNGVGGAERGACENGKYAEVRLN